MELTSRMPLWDGSIVMAYEALASAVGFAADVRRAHYGPVDGVGGQQDPFGAHLFVDNPGTPEARPVRVRDFYAEVRTQVARIDQLDTKVSALLAAVERIEAKLGTTPVSGDGGEVSATA
ncbi:hypothetical protein [Amycolatopsis sp. H20-H5]|uniref:hypothetical protein n=1 Tax=Amycolatopsis sp. H20-H5 TaxID=3046309 RepID=UPI002DB798A8|nr:hypothetical protein [Amycolatopsis sp. H20-H5]MEC3980435.1 hypothetical protein [Amycolatopsis sp. H20-H5]